MYNKKVNLIYSDAVPTAKVELIPDGVKIIQAPKFWDKSNKGEGVKIAIIDTGCDVNHPDLSDRIIEVRNFTTDDKGAVNIVTDYVGHGTHVAGIIAANENGSGIIGVAPRASLLILKALSENGGKYSWVTNAINYAVMQRVNIISMSLGGGYDDKKLHGAITTAVNNGIIVVCAAGNNGDGNYITSEISYPAGYNEVISVGSVDINRHASDFSSSNSEVDLVAPGQGIGTNGIVSTAPGGGYAEMSGTSMAAPHVAGALALIINWATSEFGRSLSETEMYAQLIKKTIPLGYAKNIEGNGMLYLEADKLLEGIIYRQDIINLIIGV